jgi:mannosyltransferase
VVLRMQSRVAEFFEHRQVLDPAVLAILVTLFGAVLRLYDLGGQSLWIDEVSQARTASLINSEGFGVVVQRDNVAPLSHWLLWAFGTLFGYSEFIIRLPSAIAGIVLVPLVYLLGRRLFDSPTAGLTAAIITAISPLAVWYAQDGRMYALAMMLVASAMLALWNALDKPHSLLAWGTFTLATTLAVYTHQYAVLVSVASGLFVLIRFGLSSPVLWRWAASQAIAALVFLPWFLYSIDRLAAQAGTPKGEALLWLPYTLFAFLVGFSYGPSVRELHWDTSLAMVRPYLAGIVPVMLAGAWAGAMGLARVLRREVRWPGVFCILWLVVPILLALLATQMSNISYNVRYVSVCFPAFAIILGASLTGQTRSPFTVMAILVLLLAMGFSLANWYTTGRYAKEDIRPVAALLAREATERDAIVILSHTAVEPLAFYGYDLPENALVVRRANLDEVSHQLRTRQPQNSARLWLLEYRAWESDPRQSLRTLLQRTRPLLVKCQWAGVDLRVYGGPEQQATADFGAECQGAQD